MIKIGVLAVQGAFHEHIECLKQLKHEKIKVVEIRGSHDVDMDMVGLIIPGNYYFLTGR